MEKSITEAVNLAAYLLKQGEPLPKAIGVASRKHNVDRASVHSGLSRRSGKSQAGKPKPKFRNQPLGRGDLAACLALIRALRKYAGYFSEGDQAALERIAASVEKKSALSDVNAKRLLRIQYDLWERACVNGEPGLPMGDINRDLKP